MMTDNMSKDMRVY